jgi:hypothetical protein
VQWEVQPPPLPEPLLLAPELLPELLPEPLEVLPPTALELPLDVDPQPLVLPRPLPLLETDPLLDGAPPPS